MYQYVSPCPLAVYGLCIHHGGDDKKKRKEQKRAGSEGQGKERRKVVMVWRDMHPLHRHFGALLAELSFLMESNQWNRSFRTF